MDIFINERSFNNQVQRHAIMQVMQQFAETVGLLQISCHNAEVVIHSSLSNRPICDNQTLLSWVSINDNDDEEADQDEESQLQDMIRLVLAALTRGPYVEDLLEDHEHVCTFADEDHEQSALAAAACLDGVVVSLDGHAAYPDGALTVELMRADGNLKHVDVPHFVTGAEARKCRRRYVPNPKHHPNKAKGNHTKMELDREYDPFELGTPKESRLRDLGRDPENTKVQKLLDSALPGGKQLYNLVYSNNGKTETFYEFMDDNTNGFHGYPVPDTQIPADVVRALRRRCRER